MNTVVMYVVIPLALAIMDPSTLKVWGVVFLINLIGAFVLFVKVGYNMERFRTITDQHSSRVFWIGLGATTVVYTFLVWLYQGYLVFLG